MVLRETRALTLPRFPFYRVHPNQPEGLESAAPGRRGTGRPNARASERRLPGAGEKRPERAVTKQPLSGPLGGSCGGDDGTRQGCGWSGSGDGQSYKVVVGGLRPGSPTVAPALRFKAPTPGSLLTCWEVREQPNFLLFNEPRRRGCPEGVCSLKM